ncbi:restriction endonuclease subunit S, partial [Elizabethkingia meningoseptica]
ADGTVKCIDKEIPFEIPESWEWCRLGSVAFYKKGPFGSSITKSMFIPESENAIKVYEQKNAIYKNAEIGSYYISEEKFDELKGFQVYPNDIIVSCAGTIGETYVMPTEIKKGIINQALMRIKLFNNEILDFYLMYFDFVLKSQANEQGKGTAIKNIPPFDILKNFLLPLPPLSEQYRIRDFIQGINEKVDCIDNDKNIVSALIIQTKSKILDLAIRGKLVPQDPNDEPASVLLERIKSEHTESKKKTKSTGDNSHYPFEIPKSWEWSTIGEISQHNTGKTLHKGRNSGTPYQYITTSNLYWDSFVLDNLKEMPFEEKELDKFSAIKGDLLICEGGDGGRSAIWTEEYAICFQNHIHRVRPFCDIKSKYIYFFMLYSSLKGSINDYKKGIGIQSLSSSSLASIRLSLPPIEEQKRIVKKIEDIFDSLNEIENSIKLKRKL